MNTDAVLIGSVLGVVGTVVVLAYFVYQGIQHIKHDESEHKNS